ncbi:MAG: N-acetylglucosamine kinase [Sediminibacterium magnilacihabitans]|jgi:glucosamine kinase|nr:N-acetylglucosamine kinase [Sediminibacterium magnilacihabitans]PQV61666.1 N-acetylglucosamine kinase-like BadF-type ATPase [Sediminibacterium magnilacihabitans]
MSIKLIADSGATKCEWCLLQQGKKKSITTQGISPYFLSASQITELLTAELLPKLKQVVVDEVFFYGTGLANMNNVKILQSVLKKAFPKAAIEVQNDLLAASRALCGKEKGIACILGTGANSCYYNGKKIVKNSPGLGYILGDEGSGAYLGKKVIQYHLYQTFDEELKARFEKRFAVSNNEILENVYKKPLANRYLASYAIFLAENRGHYMVENIIEDGLNDFFFTHLYKYRESWTLPIHFVGSIAHGFRDVLKELCDTYELELGTILKAPMAGLIAYHR